MNNKVVYIHRKATNREVFYVGIGNPRRAFVEQHRNVFWRRVVSKHGYDVEVIHTGLSWEDACDIEMDLIELIGRRDLGLGTLVNLTDGGEGNQGIVWSDERRAEKSANYTDEMRDAVSEANSKPVIDTKTGIEYKGIVLACKSLGFKAATIISQLKGHSSVQPYNTIRYLDDVNLKNRKEGYSKINSYALIDISNNKIYKDTRTACRALKITYNRLRDQISGRMDREDNNTLYRLCELVITPEGYEAKQGKTLKARKKGAKNPKKRAERGTFTYMEKYLERQKNKEVDEEIASLIAYMRQAS